MSGKRYTEEFKIEAVKQVVDRGYKISDVASRLGVTSKSLHDWVNKYGNVGSQHHTIDQQQDELDAYPAERFGFIKGRISNLAADAIETKDGKWEYSVKIAADSEFLETGGIKYSLKPGMTTAIQATTDTRRIISYFFAPIVDTTQSTMGGR